MRRFRHVSGVAAALCGLMAFPLAGAAQSDLSITAGSVFEKEMESMPSMPALTLLRVAYSLPVAGLALEYNRGNYPWPPPNPGDDPFCRAGLASLTLSAESYPLQLLARWLHADDSGADPAIHRLSNYLRPFVGFGVLHANENIPGDGHVHRDAAGQEISTQSQTAMLLTYGAGVLIPTTVRNVRIELQYRRGHRMFGDMGGHYFDGTPGPQPSRVWGQWQMGFNFVLD